MTDIDSMVEQQIREHESRLLYLDELLERARNGRQEGPEAAELSEQLATLARERDRLAKLVEQFRHRPRQDWRVEDIRQAGPMGVWDAVAQQLEKLVQRMER